MIVDETEVGPYYSDESSSEMRVGNSTCNVDTQRELGDVLVRRAHRGIMSEVDTEIVLPGGNTYRLRVVKKKDGEITAWSYDLATTIDADGNYGDWRPRLSYERPHVPDGSIRNLRALVSA